VDTDRQILEHLEPYLEQASADQAAAMIALLAVERVGFDADRLSAAVRRAVLVLASGGDLRRELTFDDQVVAGLARDVDDGERRSELTAALQELRGWTDGLPGATSAIDALLGDPDRAWRALATAVLADELTE
jgi:hypothetical protein